MWLGITVLGLFLVSFPTSEAWAEEEAESEEADDDKQNWGCQKDTDCKGDRICNKGECVSPAPTPQPAPQPAATVPAPVSQPTQQQLPDPSVRPQSRGGDRAAAARAHYGQRAHSGGVTGIVGSILALSFGLVSAAADEYYLKLGTGGAALLAVTISVPIAGAPAGSARNYFRSKGEFVPPSGLAIAGWVAYGFAVADGAILVGLGIADAEVTDGQIVSATVLGTTAAALIAADAFLVRDRLRSGRSLGSNRPDEFGKHTRRPKLRLAVAPVITPEIKQLAVVGVF